MSDQSRSGGALGGGEQGSIPCPFAETRGWEAWVNAMPGPGMERTLIVVGEVLVDSDGYAGHLTPTHQDRRMPPIQHFALDMIEEEGASAGWQAVRGEAKPAGTYHAVVIDCHSEQVAEISPVPDVV